MLVDTDAELDGMISELLIKDGSNNDLSRYQLVYSGSDDLLLLHADTCDTQTGGLPGRTTTRPFVKLQEVRRVEAKGEKEDSVLLSWSFQYNDEVYDEDPPYLPTEASGVLTQATLPNGTEIEYEYASWTSYYANFCSPSTTPTGSYHNLPVFDHEDEVCQFGSHDVSNSSSRPSFLACHPTDRNDIYGVSERRVVDPQDGNLLLEWTEYFPHGTIGMMNRWGAAFDLANTGSLAGLPIGDDPELEHFYLGFRDTVVRRHLVVDVEPPENHVNPPVPGGLRTELPSWRFDDTVHVFANGRVFYDRIRVEDGDGKSEDSACPKIHSWVDQNDEPLDWNPGGTALTGDHYGTLPIEGQPLEIRYYRGSSTDIPVTDGNSADIDTFPWWTDESPDPVRVDTMTMTLELEVETAQPPAGSFSQHLCTDPSVSPQNGVPEPIGHGTFGSYCTMRPETVRSRRSVVQDRTVAPADMKVVEHWYETDAGLPGDVTPPQAPLFAGNRVLTRTHREYLDHQPAAGELDLMAAQSYRKDSVLIDDLWLTGLVDEELRQQSTDGSFRRSTRDYDSSGRLIATTRHTDLSRWTVQDRITTYEYYDGPAGPGLDSPCAEGYGKVARVTKDVACPTDPQADCSQLEYVTGYRYECPQGPWLGDTIFEAWHLCPETTSRILDTEKGVTIDRCEGWSSAPGVFGGLGELSSQQTVDALWGRPSRVVDGNGDGIGSMTYDGLGRVVQMDPTDASLARTEIQYLDLRTAEVKVETGAQSQVQVVSRVESDGLGRRQHVAVRGEDHGSGGLDYDSASFRHQTVYRDGGGHQWAVSNWHRSLLASPSSLQGHPDFSLVRSVDPFGRVENSVDSDWQSQVTLRRGSEQQTVDSKLHRTVVKLDTRGNVLHAWEDKELQGLSSIPDETLLQDPDHFIHSGYTYNVADQLTSVQVEGLTSDGVKASQLRTFSYDGVGNLVRESYPELRDGNDQQGFMRYGCFDPLGNPKRSVLNDEYCPCQCDPGDPCASMDAIDVYYDAAGRLLQRWLHRPDEGWFLHGEAAYREPGVSTVGKIQSSVQYNTTRPSWSDQDGDSIEDSAIAVEHLFDYTGWGGALALRQTMVTPVASPAESAQFEVLYEHDQWGNVAKIEYPELTFPVPWYLPPAPDVQLRHSTVALEGVDLIGRVSDVIYDLDYHDDSGRLVEWRTIAGVDGASRNIDDIQHRVATSGSSDRIESIRAENLAGELLWNTDYAYRNDGSIVQATPFTYSYDALGRVARMNRTPGAYRHYKYDDFGNLTWQSIDRCGNTLPPVDMSNRVKYPGFDYDERGNVESTPLAIYEPERCAYKIDGVRSLRYDSLNRLVMIKQQEGPNLIAFTFLYDLDGERVARFGGSTEDANDAELRQYFLRDEQGNVLTRFEHLVPSNAWSRLHDHIYLGRKPALRLVQVGSTKQTDDHYVTLVHDHLGSTRAELRNDLAGNQTLLEYDAYGDVINTPYQLEEPHLFTGHEREHIGTEFNVLMGLDYMHARYYHHQLGRFLSVDPVGGEIGSTQSWNRYAYVLGNPLSFVDPTGEEIQVESEEDLKLIQHALDDDELASELTVETVTEEHSFLGIFSWTTSKNIVSNGNADWSDSKNPNAQLIDAAIDTDTEITFSVTNKDLSDWSGAVTSSLHFSSANKISIRFNPLQVARATVPGPGEQPINVPIGVAVIHEFGHAWGNFAEGVYGGAGAMAFGANTDPYAIEWENRSRRYFFSKRKRPYLPRSRHNW